MWEPLLGLALAFAQPHIKLVHLTLQGSTPTPGVSQLCSAVSPPLFQGTLQGTPATLNMFKLVHLTIQGSPRHVGKWTVGL